MNILNLHFKHWAVKQTWSGDAIFIIPTSNIWMMKWNMVNYALNLTTRV